MATFTKLPSGSWRVQVRRKGRYVSETFLLREDAHRWAIEAEGQVDRGDMPIPSRVKRLKTFGDLIDLHVQDNEGGGQGARPIERRNALDAEARAGRPSRWTSWTVTGSSSSAVSGPLRAPGLSPTEIRALCEREQVSQAVFSRYLNVGKDAVSKWEAARSGRTARR